METIKLLHESHHKKIRLSYFSSVVVLCVSVVSYVAFLSLFFHNVSFFWCLGRSVLRDCDISWVSSHIFWGIFDQ